MQYASPLRYPGGKAALASLLIQIRRLNGLGGHPVAEPFGGGAGAALTMLYGEETPRIEINDADPAIHAFWWAVTSRAPEFAEKLRNTPVTIAEWKRQREIHRRPGKRSRLDIGFATFYLNRCNRSGIILNGGPVGGLAQEGKWKLKARYNKHALLERCERVAEFGDRISITREDGLGFIKKRAQRDVFFFIDPPYYEKGPKLYLNSLGHEYHEALAEQMQSMQDARWVMTYDDSPAIRHLYEPWANVREFKLDYSASGRRKGSELFISPKRMLLPASAPASEAISW
ncbi:MAG: DNA adenine methylase [Thermoplasmatota archaeon]